MEYNIQNLAPDVDVINVIVGNNTDSQIVISVDRDQYNNVFICVTDNSDGSETRMTLGHSGYTQKL